MRRLLILAATIPLSAQWFNQPDPRVPRAADGKPILTAKAPRTADGKPDLSGIWVRKEGESAPPNNAQFAYRLSWFMPKGAEIPLRPAAEAIFKERAAREGGGRPSEHCLPHGVPAAMMPPVPFKIVQTPGLTLILFEDFVDYRQIFTDGRQHPATMNPAWYGYSVGHWDDDAFVVETAGFNDQSWLDGLGLPHSEDLRVTERFERDTVGHMQMKATIDDPKMYTKPWSATLQFNLTAQGELLEYVCENEKDLIHEVR